MRASSITKRHDHSIADAQHHPLSTLAVPPVERVQSGLSAGIIFDDQSALLGTRAPLLLPLPLGAPHNTTGRLKWVDATLTNKAQDNSSTGCVRFADAKNWRSALLVF